MIKNFPSESRDLYWITYQEMGDELHHHLIGIIVWDEINDAMIESFTLLELQYLREKV